MRLSEFQKGDWVAFMRNGDIVLGQVEYLVDGFPRADELVTTAGAVSPSSILERRVSVLEEQKHE